MTPIVSDPVAKGPLSRSGLTRQAAQNAARLRSSASASPSPGA